MPKDPVRVAFVGRERERRTLADRLTAETDSCSVVLIAGEAGIGKTRLMDEVAVTAQQLGVRVLSGRCYQGKGTPDYWLWTQVVRAFLRNNDVRQLSRDLQARLAGLRQVVPEMEAGPTAQAPSPFFQSEQDSFSIYDGILALVEASAPKRPLLLLLHDLQWASDESLQILDFLCQGAASLPVLILASYRDDALSGSAPLARTLASLRHLEYCETLALSGLTPSETRDLLRHQLKQLAEGDLEAVATRLQAETRGNPFYLGELARQIREDAELAGTFRGRSTDSLRLPRSLLDTLAQRLIERTPGCRTVLTAVAVVETSFDLPLVEQISGLVGPSLLEALEEAETAGLIEPLNGSMRYRFRLPIIRRAIYESIPRVRRDSLHWRVGCALRAKFGREPRRVSDIAHHLVEGMSVGDPGEAASWSELAGDRAFRLADYDEAARWHQRALEALDSLPDRTPDNRARILLELGRTHIAAGFFEEARAELEQAASEAQSSGDAALIAQVGITAEPPGMPFAEPEAFQVALLNDSLETLPEEEGVLRAKVLTQLSTISVLRNDLERAKALADEAIANSLRLGDAPALIGALSARRDAAVISLDATDGHIGCGDIVQAAESAGDPRSLIEAHRQVIVGRLEQGDVPSVERELQTYASLAIMLRQPTFAWRLALWRAAVSAISGDFDLAEQRASEAYWLGKRLSPNQASAAFAIQRIMIALIRGRTGELVPLLEEMTERMSQDPWVMVWRAFLAEVYVTSNRQDEALRELRALFSFDLKSLVPPPILLTTLVQLVSPLIAAGDQVEQERLLLLLRPNQDIAAIAFDGIAWFGPVGYYIGLLEAALGRSEPSIQSLESALALARRAKSGPWIAKISMSLSRSLLDRGRREDFERARDVLSEARSIAESLGMQSPSVDLDSALERSIRTALAPPPTPFGLSERELEVLRLLAAGRSSREIAEQLVISTRTAEHHVQNIYNKTGARRRVDAAALAGRHGLLPLTDR